MRVPADLGDFSPRQMAVTLDDHTCPSGLSERRVRGDGAVKWGGDDAFLGGAFRHEVVGSEHIEEDLHPVFLGPRRLGALDGRAITVVPLAIDVGGSAVTDEPGREGEH
jgi:hypothetical protein